MPNCLDFTTPSCRSIQEQVAKYVPGKMSWTDLRNLNRYKPPTFNQAHTRCVMGSLQESTQALITADHSDLIADAAEPGYNEAALVLRRLR